MGYNGNSTHNHTHTGTRKTHPMTLNILGGHSSTGNLFKRDCSYVCAPVEKLLTNTAYQSFLLQ